MSTIQNDFSCFECLKGLYYLAVGGDKPTPLAVAGRKDTDARVNQLGRDVLNRMRDVNFQTHKSDGTTIFPIEFYDSKSSCKEFGNFHEAPVDGYPNAEAAFQAQKFVGDEDAQAIFRSLTRTTTAVFYKGQRIIIEDLWRKADEDKVGHIAWTLGSYKKGLSRKDLTNRAILRSDWDSVKHDIMVGIVVKKFCQNQALQQDLLNTGKAKLKECAPGPWGGENGGENWLGEILMAVRSALQQQEVDNGGVGSAADGGAGAGAGGAGAMMGYVDGWGVGAGDVGRRGRVLSHGVRRRVPVSKPCAKDGCDKGVYVDPVSRQMSEYCTLKHSKRCQNGDNCQRKTRRGLPGIVYVERNSDGSVKRAHDFCSKSCASSRR